MWTHRWLLLPERRDGRTWRRPPRSGERAHRSPRRRTSSPQPRPAGPAQPARSRHRSASRSLDNPPYAVDVHVAVLIEEYLQAVDHRRPIRASGNHALASLHLAGRPGFLRWDSHGYCATSDPFEGVLVRCAEGRRQRLYDLIALERHTKASDDFRGRAAAITGLGRAGEDIGEPIPRKLGQRRGDSGGAADRLGNRLW